MNIPRYIHNVSGTQLTYRGVTIADQAFQLIDNGNLGWYQTDDTFLADMANDKIRMSADGSTDYSTSYSENLVFLMGTTPGPTDTDGAPLSRTKITRSGWHYQAHGIEFSTSKLGSLYNKDHNGNDLGFATVKFYDSNDVELVAGTQAELDNNCVKTVMDIEIDQDIEVVGGLIEQSVSPSTDVRVWVIAIPDLPVANGGSVLFTNGGINLRHISNEIDIDGKTPKMLPYNATYHTNKFRAIVKHDLGKNDPVHLILKLFRENK